MPYKSQAQRRLFHWLVKQGKLSPNAVKEFDEASKGEELPDHVQRKAYGGEVEDDEPVSPKQQKVRAHIGELMKAVGEGLRGGGEPKRRYRPFDSMPQQKPTADERITQLAHGGEIPLKGDLKELYTGKKAAFAKALRRRR